MGLALVGIRVVRVAHHTRIFFANLGARNRFQGHTRKQAPYIDRVKTLCQSSVIVFSEVLGGIV